MFEELDRVRIKGIGVVGDIVAINHPNDETIYYVESDEEGDVTDPDVLEKYDVWNLRFPIYSCTADQLEHI